MEALLEAVLYRQSCPSAEQLLDYHLGLLTPTIDMPNIDRDLRRHMALCAFCTSDLQALARIGEETAPASKSAIARAGWFQRIRKLIPNLPAFPAIPQITQPMPALRAAENDDLRVFQSGEYRLSLSVIRAPASKTVILEGNLVNPSNPAKSLVGTVYLLAGDEANAIDSQLLDDFGIFSFQNLQPSSYALAIQLESDSIWIADLDVAGANG